MKKTIYLVLCMIALVLVTACSQGTQTSQNDNSAGEASIDPITVNVMALKGPSGVGMVELMDQGSANDAITYNFNLVGSTDEVVAALANGSTDIAAIPTNLAANLYQKTGGDVRMIAINTYGNLSIVESGNAIKSMEDLRGKTIHAAGQGANPQYILEYLLTNAGLTVGTDVTIEWHAEQSEVAALAVSGAAEVCMLPEPFTSTVLAKNQSLNIALDLNDIWQEETGYPLVMGCVVVRTEFLDQHKDVVDAFLADLKTSIEWTAANPAQAAPLCVEYGIMADQAIAEQAIPRCGLTFIDGKDMVAPITNYFEILEAANPASIGGSLPDDNFYYQG